MKYMLFIWVICQISSQLAKAELSWFANKSNQTGPFKASLPSPTIGADGYCGRSMRPPVRPSVYPSQNGITAIFKDFSYRPKMCGMMHSTMKQIALWHGLSRPIFSRSMELWNYLWYARTRSEGRYCRSNSFMISAIDLQFGGMMQSIMKQIAMKNDHARPIVVRSRKRSNFPW